MSNNSDNKTNRKMVKVWMNAHAGLCEHSTQAAEECADDLDLCDNDADCTIPEYIFEIAGEYFDDNGPICR